MSITQNFSLKMATFTNDDLHEIQMDSGSEDDSEMNTDEVYSSDVHNNRDATGQFFLRPGTRLNTEQPVDWHESLATSLILYESYLTLKHYTYYLRFVSLSRSICKT